MRDLLRSNAEIETAVTRIPRIMTITAFQDSVRYTVAKLKDTAKWHVVPMPGSLSSQIAPPIISDMVEVLIRTCHFDHFGGHLYPNDAELGLLSVQLLNEVIDEVKNSGKWRGFNAIRPTEPDPAVWHGE
jgi:hypothetical protein